MARLVRPKSGHLDFITQQIRILRDLVDFAGEESLLVIEARAPGEIAADLQVLAEAVPHHVGGVHAFGRVGVMRATGGVDVMVARPPAAQRRVDPAFELDQDAGFTIHADGLMTGAIFRAARRLDRVNGAGQVYLFAVRSINLRLKGEVGRQAFGQRGIDAALAVADRDAGGGRFSIFVEYSEADFV